MGETIQTRARYFLFIPWVSRWCGSHIKAGTKLRVLSPRCCFGASPPASITAYAMMSEPPRYAAVAETATAAGFRATLECHPADHHESGAQSRCAPVVQWAHARGALRRRKYPNKRPYSARSGIVSYGQKEILTKLGLSYCSPALRKPSRNFAIGPGV